MSNLGLSICVSGYDTENIKQALSRTENGKLDFWSLISGLFKEIFQTKIPDYPILHRNQLPPDMISCMDTGGVCLRLCLCPHV